jgi:hypothetical protein
VYISPTHVRLFAESASACACARNGAWQVQTASAMLRRTESFLFLIVVAIARRLGVDALHGSQFLFDDLKRSPEHVIQEVCRFLWLDPGFVPDFATLHTVGGTPASRLLEGVLTSRAPRSEVDPGYQRGRRTGSRLRSRSMRQAPSLPRELRAELTNHFCDDILQTSELVARSLDHWL